MNVRLSISLVFILTIFGFSVTTGLNILTVLPCYGGHFGAMVSIIQLLSRDNHVTVVSTSPVCEKKLIPLQKRASFELIKEDLIAGYADMESEWQLLQEIGALWTGFSRNLSLYFDTYLKKNKDKVDIIIADFTNAGVFFSAESFDKPIIISTPGTSLAVEYADEKGQISFVEMLVYKYALYAFDNYIERSRLERKLPNIVSQNDLIPFDYLSRFPSIVYASPSFFPQPHKSVDFIYIGGYRNDTEKELLSAELQDWLNLDSLDIIYVSMGTHIKISNDKIQDFTEKIREQNRFRVVWSLSVGMQKAVADLGLTSDRRMFFSKYLPQYTLLGHPKVKVFVTHGGLLSTIDVIKRMKPSVCIPMFGDQFYNCGKIKSWGISETVSDFNFENINETVIQILTNYQKYLQNASKYEQDISKYEDIEALNNFVKKIADRGKTTLIKEFEFQLLSTKVTNGWLVVKLVAVAAVVLLLVLVIKGFVWMMRPRKSEEKSKTS